MVGDALAHRCHRHQALLPHQAVEELRVVHHLVLRAELRVLVGQRVEAVRTGHDDLLALRRRRLENPVDGLDVLLRQHLEQELVAGTSCRIAGTGLALAENHEVHRGDVEELGDRLGGLLRAILVCACATDPEEVLETLERFDVGTEDRDLDVHLVDPVGARRRVLTPGVALVLEVLEHARELGREVGLDEHLVAAHVDDVVDMLDVDGTLLDARTAGGAAPQGFGVDNRTELLGVEFALFRDDALAAAHRALRLTDQLARRLSARGLGNLGELRLVDVALGVDESDLVAAHVLAATGDQIRRLGLCVIA